MTATRPALLLNGALAWLSIQSPFQRQIHAVLPTVAITSMPQHNSPCELSHGALGAARLLIWRSDSALRLAKAGYGAKRKVENLDDEMPGAGPVRLFFFYLLKKLSPRGLIAISKYYWHHLSICLWSLL